jgi:hypothetical protein
VLNAYQRSSVELAAEARRLEQQAAVARRAEAASALEQLGKDLARMEVDDLRR